MSQNADRKIKSIFELFIKQKFDFKFVLFSIGQTLYHFFSKICLILVLVTVFDPAFLDWTQMWAHFGGSTWSGHQIVLISWGTDWAQLTFLFKDMPYISMYWPLYLIPLFWAEHRIRTKFGHQIVLIGLSPIDIFPKNFGLKRFENFGLRRSNPGLEMHALTRLQ